MQVEELLADYEIRKLGLNDRGGSFDCGDEDLNDFIINDAPLYRKALLAMTYVMENKTTGKVIAYFMCSQ